MKLKYGPITVNAHSYCTGCHEVVYMYQRYIMLSLDSADSSVKDTDLCYAYFHNQHCISLMIKRAENYADIG